MTAHDENEKPPIARIALAAAICIPCLYAVIWGILYYEYPKARAETHAIAVKFLKTMGVAHAGSN